MTCYESNEERVRYVKESFDNLRYETSVITSDFSHIKKAKRNNVPEGYFALETKQYNKNLSIDRLVSHARFAKDAFEVIEEKNPDVVWVMAPANSLIKEARSYKKKHSNVRLIVDIIDMWPESLPISMNKNIFPLRLWKNIRTNNIKCADKLTVECDFYKEILSKEYGKDITTLRWAKEDKATTSRCVIDDSKLSLVYLGSINNIIDIEGIKNMISKIAYPVKLNIIGEGEKTEDFVNSLKDVCEVEYHGVVREKNKKADILSKCHAGINFYRDGLYIGLTVKCIDYFLHGLPIINNIKGDTWKMVKDDGVGFNVTKDTVVDAKKVIELRKDNERFVSFYNSHFTSEIFMDTCKKVIESVK